MLFGEIARAVRTAGFFVGDECEHDVARWPPALTRPVADERECHRVHVLHVDGATTPQAIVANLAATRIDLPVGSIRRYDVDVTMNQESGPARVLAGPTRDDGCTAGCRLVHLRSEAG